MQTFSIVQPLQSVLSECISEGKTVALVPTMGALHQGHLSLIAGAREKADFVVVSIFVNPTQFNESEDYDKYPRTVEADAKLLESAKCDFLFTPAKETMYPDENTKVEAVDYGPLTHTMEGFFRPGHFDGMAHIVHELLKVVNPDFAFFGEKDFQQLAIVRKMAKEKGLKTEIIGMPIIREDSGLAMSSRNARMDKEEAKHALALSNTLRQMKLNKEAMPLKELAFWGREQLEASLGVDLEYLEIVNPHTFKTLEGWAEQEGEAIALLAAFVGPVRLLDNMVL